MINEVLWYYIDKKGEKKGPISNNEIDNLIDSEIITSDTLIWNNEMKDWEEASKTILGNKFVIVAPPIPISKISSKWVWPLATIPLFVSILCSSLGINVTISSIVVLVLNIIFISKDIDYLKKSGIAVDGWMWVELLLVPIYLFVRASKTDKNWAYGIVWCVLFIISM